jgi:hypothetical protein
MTKKIELDAKNGFEGRAVFLKTVIVNFNSSISVINIVPFKNEMKVKVNLKDELKKIP